MVSESLKAKGAPRTLLYMEAAVSKMKDIRSNETVKTTTKWARGTMKGVAIAAAAQIAGEGVKQGLSKALKHKSR